MYGGKYFSLVPVNDHEGHTAGTDGGGPLEDRLFHALLFGDVSNNGSVVINAIIDHRPESLNPQHFPDCSQILGINNILGFGGVQVV